VSFRVNGKDFNSREESEDMYVSVDRVVEKLERQIQKHKGKRFNKKSPKLAEIGVELPPETDETLAQSQPGKNEIIPADPIEFPVMTLEDAVDKLVAEDNGYNIFSNTKTKRLTVLFKREDGTLGLIEA
jgi:putative sigma-54 modulation protein